MPYDKGYRKETPIPDTQPEKKPRKQKSKKYRGGKSFKLYGWILFITIMAGSGAVGFFLANNNNADVMFHTEYARVNGKPRLLCFFIDSGYSEDDGSYLSGYNIRYINPADGKVLSEFYIDRYCDDLPPWPLVKYVSADNIWIVQPRAFVQGDTGFVRKIRIVNDELVPEHKMVTARYTPDRFWGNDHLRLLNHYNEVFCADLVNNAVSEGECPGPTEKNDTTHTAFVLVKKDASSARSRIFYYETSRPDPMQVMVNPHDRVSLLYNLHFSHNTIAQADFDLYKSQLKPDEKIAPVFADAWLLNANCILETASLAVYVENDTDAKRVRYYCFDKTGKQLWKTDEDAFQQQVANVSPKCVLKDNLVVISTMYWVFAMNNVTGKMQWKYIP